MEGVGPARAQGQEDGLVKVDFWKKSWAGDLNSSAFLSSYTRTKRHEQEAPGAEQGKVFFLQAHNLCFFSHFCCSASAGIELYQARDSRLTHSLRSLL